MKILLAPSETKTHGGSETFNIENLIFPKLNPVRKQLLHHYINTIQQKDPLKLSKMFGLKKTKDIEYHTKDIVHELAMKAIERYTGVAFDYLDYKHLDNDAKNYIDNNVVLCSNLFGFLRADDMIPEYRLKQGEMVGELKPE
ncbi:MAG: peroxide stress protein YaaA, partial [Epsilonproteobacteria bacterium]|nr:peroxide stress protein YaaA [Campylobacterota bacterium]